MAEQAHRRSNVSFPVNEHEEKLASRAHHGGGPEENPASVVNHLTPGMDPNYRGHHPWSYRTTPARRPRTIVRTGDFAWVQELRDEQVAQFKSKLLRRLDLVPAGQRIRNLRAVLGWTQRAAALQLGISMRTVIRYEQGHHRVSWPRLPLLRRLRELESEHAQELIAYHTRGGPYHA
jgi:DNA-binding XRE family transcriptional regulator